jgi:hypothetical protein
MRVAVEWSALFMWLLTGSILGPEMHFFVVLFRTFMQVLVNRPTLKHAMIVCFRVLSVALLAITVFPFSAVFPMQLPKYYTN